MLVGRDGTVRFLADAEAMAASNGRVLVRRVDRRIGLLTVGRTFTEPKWLPSPSAVEVTGPAVLSADGSTFAVLARVNEHARLMVGPTRTTDTGDLHVVALEGGPPQSNPAPPAFTSSGWVLAARPDGKIVYYRPGDLQGRLLEGELPAVSAVVET